MLKSNPYRLVLLGSLFLGCVESKEEEKPDAVVTTAKAASAPESHVDDLELLRGEWQIFACDRDGADPNCFR